MDRKDLFERKLRFEKEIMKHKNFYYNQSSEISNEQYDVLVEGYHKILDMIGISLEESVARKIGAPITSLRDVKVEHKISMGGLEKITDSEQFDSFINKIEYDSRFGTSYVAIPKYNGISVDLQFKNKELVRAVSRGNNIYGVDISEKVFSMKLNIKNKEFILDGNIRGEIIITNEDWKNFPNKDNYANQLNAVIGICNADYDDKYKDLYSYLTVIPFNYIYFVDGYTPPVFKNSLVSLRKVFGKVDAVLVPSDISYDKLQFIYEGYKEKYPIDGLVLTVYHDYVRYDVKGEYPKNQFAVKFVGDTEVFEIDYIEWQMSRRGKLTPVTVFKESKQLSGVIVQRASAFNAEFVELNKIGLGAKVEVVRSGEIIPYILQVVKESACTLIPDTCYYCNSKLVRKSVEIYCENKECLPKKISKLHHFLSSVGLKHFGESAAETLVNMGYDRPEDLFKVTKEELLQQPNWEEIKASKLMTELKKLEKINALDFFTGLGVEGISYEMWKIILDKHPYSRVLDIFAVKHDESIIAFFSNIPGVGEARINTLVEVIMNNDQIVSTVEKFYDRLYQVQEKKLSFKLEEYRVEVTGKMYQLKREELKKLAIEHGAKKTGQFNLLVANEESTSSKYVQAKKKGIKIIKEKEFLEMIED